MEYLNASRLIAVAPATDPSERRVAIVPGDIGTLLDSGYEVSVLAGAGERAGHGDAEYRSAGAGIAVERGRLLAGAAVAAIAPYPDADDLAALPAGSTVVGLLDPIARAGNVAAIAERGLRAFAFEMVPRISRAQSLDALSAMATLAGYKAVLVAANRLPQIFPLLMTAAGTLAPAKVTVLGVGVAGLQAIATARRLGARVSAYDVREEVREQVESLGAQFIELDLDIAGIQTAGGYARDQSAEFLRRQREQLGSVLADADVVITAALVAGARAPVLVTDEMLARMRPGSVLIDLAAAKGGNCAATTPGATIERGGVAVVGLSDAESQLAAHASQMYSRNLARFLALLAECEGDPSRDEILAESLVAADGRVRNQAVLDQLSAAPGGGEPDA